MKQLLSILFWSVIAAAFIGPGTVTTAAKAGSGFGFQLLWALSFSTLACLVLQEAAARVTVLSGYTLGQALRRQYRGPVSGPLVVALVLGAIVLGCAAYEAGNIVGGVAGAALGTSWPQPLLTVICALAAALLLWFGAPRQVARLLSVFVAVMGVAFLVTAWQLVPPLGELLQDSVMPALPAGSGLLVLGLIGTTVVPYNLFLGSGLARGQTLPEVRLGLTVAVVLGGLISMGIAVVGTAVAEPFSFAALASVLAERLGDWARLLFAGGLWAAGFSSAITAPLAAALTARSLFADGDDDPAWSARSARFRAVWLGVLAVGVGFGLAGVQPIPVILLAQALNGLLLPLVAVFLLLVVNDRQLMGKEGLNGPLANTVLGAVVAVTLVLGAVNIAKATWTTLSLPLPGEGYLLLGAGVVALALAGPVVLSARRRRAS